MQNDPLHLAGWFWEMVGHPGYAPGVSRSQAERISIFLVPDEKWRSRRVMLPLSPVRQTGESAVPLHDLEKAGQECPVSLVKWCGVTVMLRAGSMSTGVTVRVASLAIYHRVDWLQGLDLHQHGRRMRPAGALALPAFEKWWTRTVTLRHLLCARQPCSSSTPRALWIDADKSVRITFEEWHGGWVTLPHRRGFGDRRIACLPPP
jgi:hypothetical protein